MPYLLAIVELGGYPNFTPLYRKLGYEVIMVSSVRKAIAELKRMSPDIVVAEFNFQSDFRDRTSSLESLLAVVQRLPDTKVVVFYDSEQAHQLERLKSVYPLSACLPFPVQEQELQQVLLGLASTQSGA